MKYFTIKNYLFYCKFNNLKPSHISSLNRFKNFLEKEF